MKNKSNLQDQSLDDLKAMYFDLSKDIFQLKNEIAVSRKIEKPHMLKAKKRERARVLTVVHQKGGSIR